MKRTKQLIISLIALLCCSTGVWALQQDAEGNYLLSTAQDWTDFANGINNGTIAATANVKITGDFTATMTIGNFSGNFNTSKVYSGTFDGNHHTITAEINNGSKSYVALISSIRNATIKDLTVTGSISGGQHCSGLVSVADGTNTISNVSISATITGSDTHCAGFLGHSYSSATTIDGCSFIGTINGRSGGSTIGVFNGWSHSNSVSINNCVEAGTYTNNSTFNPIAISGLASYSNNFFITPAKNNYAKYGTQLSASIPDGEVYGQITIANATYNIPAVISGIAEKYELIDEPLTPAPIVTYRGITLEKGKDYTVSYSNNDVEGTATITVAGKGNYFGSKDIEFTVYTTEYHLIGTAQQLKDYATMVNSGATYASGKLIADIDLAGDDDNQWTPIGTTSNKFNGTFDGQGYTIKNLYYKQQVENIGLFGFTTNDAYIKNVRVEGMIDITNPGGSNSGGKNCTAGGIVGNATGGVILNCSFSGTVASYSHTGGIVGQSGNTVIVNCYNEGTVIAPSNKLQELGGIVGAGGGTRINCYNVGDVKNTVSGGVVIYPIANSAINCYYRNGCCQSSSSAGWSNGNVGGGTAMSADDMKSESFISTLNANVASLRATYPDICEWKLNSDGYPVHANRKVIEMTPYAIWCEGNKTLYFDYIAQELAAGDTYDGQTVTAVWSGENVTMIPIEVIPAWVTPCKETVTRVVIKEGFKLLRPTNLNSWFCRFEKMQEIIGLGNLNTSQVTDMSYLFFACTNLQSIDVSGFNTQNVTTMESMFSNCRSLQSIDLSSFNTSQVTEMNSMFSNCKSLQSLDVSGFDTQNVTEMNRMFYECYGLQSLDLSNFDTQKVTNMGYMFASNGDLHRIYVGDLWKTDNVSYSVGMFSACWSLVGGDGTKYNGNYTDKTRAYAGDGGYLTYSPAYLVGDANGNGEVEIGDVTSVLTLMATPEATGYNNQAADANGNGEIEIGDVTTILTIMANGN